MTGSEDDPLLLAGEYVLGSLDVAEMREAEAMAARDPVFAGEIMLWQQRLVALATVVTPVKPPPALWSRLELATGSLDARARPATARAAHRRSGNARWKIATGFSLAIAASLALFAFLPRPPASTDNAPRFVAALGPLASPARFLAETSADGTISVTSLSSAGPVSGRAFQLWALPQGSTVPVSLGVLPPTGHSVKPTQRASAQEQLLVSDEPAGGSPTGAPTGAVLFGGTLVPLSPAAKPGL